MTPHEFSQAVLAKLASFGAPEPTNQTPRGVLWDLGEPFDEVFLLCEGLPATIVLYSGPTGLHVSHVELPYAAWAVEVAALILAGPLGCLDCLRRGESPYASHQMLTDALNDCVASERKMGIEAGFFWRYKAAATVVYDDLSVSRGMRAGIEHAHQIGCPVEWRKLGGKWS